MNTFFVKIKKALAIMFALLLGCTTTACDVPFELPFDLPLGNSTTEQSSPISEETENPSNSEDSQDSQDSQTPPSSEEEDGGDDDNGNGDNTDDGNGDGDGGDVENERTEEEEQAFQEAGRIMDMAYALSTGTSLDGTYTLTGVVNYIDIDYTDSKGVCLYMNISEPQNREIYCYQLKGTGADLIDSGDTITVSGTIKNYKGLIEFDKNCTLVSYTLANGTQGDTPGDSEDPYKNVSETEFYANYTVATSNEDAYYRSQHGFMSGSLTVPDQAPTISSYRPMVGTAYVRNSEMRYEEDGKAYVVTDAYGNEAFTVYKDGAYITLEEVAAYVYAFGSYPKNQSTSKNATPSSSIWGEYLRLNHTSFSGDTSRYPYEPKLPNISGCGGNLNYYEMDIGTTGTDCDPSYTAELYNDGYNIVRGAARIVYGKRDLNGNGIWEQGEFHVFYTYNHYNDFQEYLNYAGGWGEKFGNITGGGTISSKYDYNPTDYVPVSFGVLSTTPSVFSSRALVSRYFGL